MRQGSRDLRPTRKAFNHRLGRRASRPYGGCSHRLQAGPCGRPRHSHAAISAPRYSGTGPGPRQAGIGGSTDRPGLRGPSGHWQAALRAGSIGAARAPRKRRGTAWYSTGAAARSMVGDDDDVQSAQSPFVEWWPGFAMEGVEEHCWVVIGAIQKYWIMHGHGKA